ncbi:MAG: hypothetical protein Q4D32_12065 [Eubacteriales bacterium]|nr:hypothetical protein [Eubacteriales bacterium]
MGFGVLVFGGLFWDLAFGLDWSRAFGFAVGLIVLWQTGEEEPAGV